MEHGICADFIPSEYTAETLGKELPSVLEPGDRVLILRALEGSRDLDRELSSAGADFEVRSIYRTIELGAESDPKEQEAADYIVFASGSGVRSYFASHKKGACPGDPQDQDKKAGRLPVPVCIGQITAAELEKQGIHDYITAPDHTVKGILESIEADLRAAGI